MQTTDFWRHLAEYGGLQGGWWYAGLALPSLALCATAFVSTFVAARHIARPWTAFVVLLVACVPALLVFPSAFVAWRPQQALALLDWSWPVAPNAIPLPTTRTLAQELDRLARLGIAGALAALLLFLASLAPSAARRQIPIVGTAVTRLTQLVHDRTQLIGSATPLGGRAGDVGGRPEPGLSACPFGRLEVLSGAHAGTQFAVRPGYTLGRKDCDITISDPVASREHARFGLDEQQQTTVADPGSSNGLWILREGDEQRVDVGALRGTPFALQPGDVISLGDPDASESRTRPVRLRFAHDYL